MSPWSETLRRVAPRPVKSAVQAAFLKLGRNVNRPFLAGRGTVQDLYYWVADGRTDTNVLLNNFYSAFFPALDTATTGTLTAFDPAGKPLGVAERPVPHLGYAKLTLSRLLDEWGLGPSAPPYGTVLFTLVIPPDVLAALSGASGAFYFWHRFYIEYVTAGSQPAFVHCVDKTFAFRHGRAKAQRWYRWPRARDWAPELPVDIEDYARLSVILMNRTSRPRPVTLTVADTEDERRSFTASIPSNGVHRFELTRAALEGLRPRALRLQVTGMPTTWARPVLFKEFANGTMSTMHC